MKHLRILPRETAQLFFLARGLTPCRLRAGKEDRTYKQILNHKRYQDHYTIPMNDIFNLNSTILPEDPRKFPRAAPSGTSLGSGHIS